MNVYFIGMCISMLAYIVVGLAVSRKIKSTDDYYVAGRRAPVVLVAGSLVASYIGTGMFMGDAAMYYNGSFSVLMIVNTMASSGYILGSVFYGRYLRRSGVMTVPGYFEKRFDSRSMRVLAAAVSVVIMTVYMITVVKGISTLMHVVTGLDNTICSFLAVAVFTFVTVVSGSTGVLMTDTMMSSLFTIVTLAACFVIAGKAGGWFESIKAIATNPQTKEYLSWGSQPGVIMNTGWENMIWAFANGIVWMSVTMVSPWQTSRYMMAKDESTVVKSAIPAALGIFVINVVVSMSALFVNRFDVQLEDSSHVLIWAAMNVLPVVLGVLLLTGVLAAGISSATTFLSLIGSSVANDLLPDRKNRIRAGQIAMVIAAVIVLVYNIFSPPGLFWIMYMGGTTVCSAFMPVTIGSILSRRLTKAGAFAGMLAGFVSCFGLQVASNLIGFSLPIWLDPSIVGFVCSFAAMVIASAVTQVTEEEKAARAALFVIPESEKDPAKVRSMFTWVRASFGVGIIIAVVLIFVWALPYMRAVA